MSKRKQMEKKQDKRAEQAQLYRDGLGHRERERYFEKLSLIGNKDPYELHPASWSEDPSILPPITHIDIINYLIFTPSPYTAEDLRSYKGLEAYNQMLNGWVREPGSQVISDKCVMKAKVGK